MVEHIKTRKVSTISKKIITEIFGSVISIKSYEIIKIDKQLHGIMQIYNALFTANTSNCQQINFYNICKWAMIKCVRTYANNYCKRYKMHQAQPSDRMQETQLIYYHIKNFIKFIRIRAGSKNIINILTEHPRFIPQNI